jgi:hypothetical protein
MDSLKKKFGAAPQPSFFGLVLQFHQGQVYVPAKKATWHCREAWDVRVASEVPKINPDGDCDVGLRVEIQKGISANHAKTVSFSLSDNERAKANFAADFAYFSSYVQELRGATRGAQPKL